MEALTTVEASRILLSQSSQAHYPNTGVNSSTSNQHRDLRPEPVRLSQNHTKLFTDFFAARAAFPSHHNTLTDISTGVVAAPNINYYDTFEVGRAAAATLLGVPFTDIKMKRGDRVIDMAARAQELTCRAQTCEISPNLLFQRITVFIDSHHKMKEFLTYGLSQQHLALFQHGLLRKNNKSGLSIALKEYVEELLTTSLW